MKGSVNNEMESQGSTAYAINASTKDGHTSVAVNGDASVKNTGEEYGEAIGIRTQTSGENSNLIVTVGGNVNAQSSASGSYSAGISSANRGGTINVNVEKSVSAEGEAIFAKAESFSEEQYLSSEEDLGDYKEKARLVGTDSNGEQYYRYDEDEDGVSLYYYTNADGTFNYGYKTTRTDVASTTNIHVGEDVTGRVRSEARTSGSDIIINVDGNVNGTVSGSATEGSNALTTIGGDITADTDDNKTAISIDSKAGNVTIAVEGDIAASRYGIDASSYSEKSNHEMTKEEIDALDAEFVLDYEGTSEDEDGNTIHHASYTYEDVNGNVYYYETLNGEFDRGYATIRNDKDAVNAVNVAKNVIVNSEDYAYGIDHYQDNRLGTDSITVGGDVSVTASGKEWATGIRSETYNGETAIDIHGEVKVESENGGVTGISSYVNDGTETIQIDGGVNVKGKPVNEDVEYVDEDGTTHTYHDTEEIQAIRASVDGANGKLTIAVMDDVTAEAVSDPELATAIQIYNSSYKEGAIGELDMLVTGNVESTGTGLYIDSEDMMWEYLEGTAEIKEEELYRTNTYIDEETQEKKESKLYYNSKEDYFYNDKGKMWRQERAESGHTDVKILGDVHGDDKGIVLDNTENTNVLVDGTVSGENSAILVKESALTDTLTLTVWEIVPDQDGNYIETQTGTDENGNEITEENKELLQKVQYIIRINPTQTDMISTEGTSDQDGYQVAREGETVTLKLSIPSGYTLKGVYGDVPMDVRLLQDANGEYYLVVPRGGGVLLSLDLEAMKQTATASATFYPNGGSVNGYDKKFTRSAEKNHSLRLPVPDEREGYQFAGWYESEISPEASEWKEPAEDAVLQMGDENAMIRKNNTIFVAIWKSAE